ncbi:MAG TPA: ECF-type sigma factor [Roseateles sp.]
MDERGKNDTPITQLLQAWRRGEKEALAQLLERVHAELLRMAASRLRGAETPTLAAGDLLNEALIKVIAAPADFADRAHFFATMARAMRSILVDHARARLANKRGGEWSRVTFTLSDLGEDSQIADLLTLDAALNRLDERDPRGAQVLQLTYFAGMQRSEIAEVLGLSVPTIDRELRFARAWLSQELQRDALEG